MTVSIPAFALAQANVKVTWAPALANPAAATAAELNGASAVDVGNFMLEDWDGVTGQQATGEQTRFTSSQSFDVLGKIKRGLAQLVYTYKPQELGTTPGNKAKTALAAGNTGFLVVGYDKNPATAWATADKYEVVPAACGVQVKNARGADEFAPLTITQNLGVTGTVVDGTVA